MDKEFIVLYTGQKQKKAKTWHDGILKHDGRGTKALLYDEKGGKLDSIHIKVQDIVLGEQLESDRYYILVETEKDVSKGSEASSQNVNKIIPEEKPSSQKGVYSQARCAGLKRKNTGFMPPRLVKQARHEDQEVPDRSPLRLQNKIYPSQNDSMPYFHQTSSMESPNRQNLSQENNVHRNGPGEGRNVLSLYSRDNLYTMDKGCSSPASINSPALDRSLSVSPAMSLSPWSVYGAKRTQSPKVNRTSSDHDEIAIDKSPNRGETNNKVFTHQYEKSGYKSDIRKASNGDCPDRTSVSNVDDSRTSVVDSNNVRTNVCGLDNTKGFTNRPTGNSMQRIMNLLRINKGKKLNDNTGKSCDIKNEKCAIDTKDKNFITGDSDMLPDQNCDMKIKSSSDRNFKSFSSDSKGSRIHDQQFDSERNAQLSSFYLKSQESKVTSSLGESCDENVKSCAKTFSKTDSTYCSNIPVKQDIQISNDRKFEDNESFTNVKTESYIDTSMCSMETNFICDKTIKEPHDEVVTECTDQQTTSSNSVDIEEDSEGWFGLTFSPVSHDSDSEQDQGTYIGKPSQLNCLVNTSQVNNSMNTSQQGSKVNMSQQNVEINTAQDHAVVNIFPQVNKEDVIITKTKDTTVKSLPSGEQQIERKFMDHKDNQEISKVVNTTPDQLNSHENDTGIEQSSNSDDIELLESKHEHKDKLNEIDFNDKKLKRKELERNDFDEFDSFEVQIKEDLSGNDVIDSNVKDYSMDEISNTDMLDTITIEEGKCMDKISSVLDTAEGQQEDIHTGSHISRSSQDTMDFSCDTLCDESQNYLSQDLLSNKITQKSQQADGISSSRTDKRFPETEHENVKLSSPLDDRTEYKYANTEKDFQSRMRGIPDKNIRNLNGSNVMTGLNELAFRQRPALSESALNQESRLSAISSSGGSSQEETCGIPIASYLTPQDGTVPSYGSSDDDLYGQLYNEPRLMYPNKIDSKHEGLSPLVKSTDKKPPYMSSLQRYKNEITGYKQLGHGIIGEQYGNRLIQEQNKNHFRQELYRNQFESQNENQMQRDDLLRCEPRKYMELSENDSIKSEDSSIEFLIAEKHCHKVGDPQPGVSEVKSVVNSGNISSKWDQYVPEQNEDEIDLMKFKRKESVNKDFSVVKSSVQVLPKLEQLRKSETKSIPQKYSTFKDNELNIYEKASLHPRDNITQKVKADEAFNEELFNSSTNDKIVSETPEYVSSIDSQDLLCAVEDVEKSLVEKSNTNDDANQDGTEHPSKCDSEHKLEQSEYKHEKNDQLRTDKGQMKYECGDEEIKISDKPREIDAQNWDNNTNNKSSTENIINFKSVTKNDTIKLPENRQSSSDDSLNLSLSFEEKTEPFVPFKSTNNQQAPSLRGGWKPPVRKLDCETSDGNNDNRSSRFLKILQKANTSPALEDDSLEIGQFDGDSRKDEFMNIHKTNVITDLVIDENVQAQSKADRNKCHVVNKFSGNKGCRNGFRSPVLAPQGLADVPDTIPQQTKNSRFRPPSLMNTKSPGTLVQPARRSFDSPSGCQGISNCGPKLNCTELCFPSRDMVEFSQTITRQVVIPESFTSVHQYKQVLTAAVIENLNSILFDISTRYHQALSRIDTSTYEKSAQRSSASSVSVQCKCGSAAKLLSVRKEGPNKGRQFYGCGENTQQRCKFFQWVDGKVSNFNSGPGNQRKISDGNSLGLYMKDQHVHFYPECLLVRKTKENIIPYFKRPKWARGNREEDTVQKKQLFLKLPRKGHSSLYAKDDLWIISKDLDFHPSKTFVARSTFYGPLSSNEVEIDPLYGYSPSNWSGEVSCHGLLAGNASSELSCLENIKEHLSTQSPPVLPHLLNRKRENRSDSSLNGFNVPRLVSSSPKLGLELLEKDAMDDIVCRYINEYRLNSDQTEALRRVSHMFCQEKIHSVNNVLLLHGVFGAGKSFLLSVMVLFLVEIFKMISHTSIPGTSSVTWKLLISSTTNVAVDRILQGVLNLGFEDFVRVGSVKKIAKPILPFSIHASGTDNQELKDLQEMLRSSDLTPAEKSHVRQSIEKHRQGENKKKLGAVRVVGVTCASCSVPSLNNMQFPVVFLDECSQMTEPSSLLPIARFGCQKLLLVGDPKQLDPTIEGAKPAHDQSLEQTMFDRMIKMGSIPTILRTQYRCHPWISAISNQLFYGDILYNGVTEVDRQRLLDILPTICFYDVDRGQECCERGGSFYNEQEAQFVVFLLQVLTTSGIESSSIGVITLYKSQMSRIMDLIATSGDDPRLKGVQVSTVDAFQGGERDIIILSCVRTQACGFIDNDKRTNVALTRAKHHLLIVGNYRNLSCNFIWGKVLEHCKGHKDGLQCADDAKQQLELYLQNMESQKLSIEDDACSGKEITQRSNTKGGKNSQSRKRKRKVTSPSSHELSIQTESQEISTGSSITSRNSQIPVANSQSEVIENSVIAVSDEVGRQSTVDVDTCAEEAISLGLPGDKKTPEISQSPIKSRSRQKYSDRLRSDWSEDELQEDSDVDFPVFKL